METPISSSSVRKVLGTATAVAAGGAAAAKRRMSRSAESDPQPPSSEPRSGWHAVTINCAPDEVMRNGQRPAPLASFGDAVEVSVAAAPAGRGSELRARLRKAQSDGSSPSANDVRSALREAKQLAEVGEVLRVDPTPHGHRSHTPAGAGLEAATRAAGGGVL